MCRSQRSVSSAGGIRIQPFLSRITKNAVEGGMNKQAVLVETLNGLETVTATGWKVDEKTVRRCAK